MRKTYDWGKVKWAVLTVFAAAFMFFAVSMECFAAEGTITAGSAKIRGSASTSGDHVSSAKKGEKFTIIGQENGADGKVWYKITYSGDKVGYVRSDLMSVSGDVPEEQPATYNPTVAVTDLTPIAAKVTGSSVRVRPDAAASGGVVTSVVRDTVLTIDGQATGSDGKVWYRVNCTVSGENVLGFVREDFVSVQGELTPPSEGSTPQAPVEVPDVPQDTTPSTPVTPQEPKAYETVYENDKWYLLNNDKNEKYIIDDVFSAVDRNHELATKYEKTASTQKVFLWILSGLLVLCVAAIALLVWKLKDMMDEAYFKQVEKKTLRDREGAPKKVMHTIGDEKKSGTGQPQRKPGQPSRPGQPGQKNAQRPAGEGTRKPAGQPRPTGEAPRKPVARPEGEKPMNKPATQPQRPQGESVKKPVTGEAAPAQQMPQKPKAPQAGGAQPQQTNAKPQGFQSKNFMADEDEFEFEFLNWDGVEDE